MITANLSGNKTLQTISAAERKQLPDNSKKSDKKQLLKKTAVAASTALSAITIGVLLAKGKLNGLHKFIKTDVQKSRQGLNSLRESVELPQINNICPKEEYSKTLEKLLGFEKRYITSGGMIQNTREGNVFYRFDSNAYRTVPEELKGLLPYCGEADISADINMFLRNNVNGKLGTVKEGSLVYSKDFLKNNKEMLHLDSDSANDFVRCLDYSLEQIDKKYGTFEGFVYRGGLFNGDAKQFYSTSTKVSPVQGLCQRGHNLQFHLIKTNNGHKIYEFQREYNPANEIIQIESEVLLPRNSKYTEITNTQKYAKEKQDMAQALYDNLFKDTEVTIDDILSKIHVWEQVL